MNNLSIVTIPLSEYEKLKEGLKIVYQIDWISTIMISIVISAVIFGIYIILSGKDDIK